MKQIQEERLKAIKVNVKALKGGLTHFTKKDIVACYTADVNYLMRELAKAVKVSV